MKIPFIFFDVINENKYINIASMYNDLNPKYIALYSKQPPTIAPIIFEDKATITERAIFNSYENAKPEKNNGIVRNRVPKIWSK